MNRRAAWFFVCLLGLACVVPAQSTEWKERNEAGLRAYRQGQYAEAEKFFLAALKHAETFGEKDARLATSLNNLALLYDSQGKYAEAQPLYRRSLAIWEKALGPEHPDVAANLNNLAVLYRNQGKYAEARPLYRRSLAIREKALGPEHPDVAQSLENYAELLRKTNRVAEAATLEARARAIREKQGRRNPRD